MIVETNSLDELKTISIQPQHNLAAEVFMNINNLSHNFVQHSPVLINLYNNLARPIPPSTSVYFSYLSGKERKSNFTTSGNSTQ